MVEPVVDKPLTRRSAFQPGVSANPGGKPKVDQEFSQFLTQPFDQQRKDVEQSWLELAYVLPRKALRLALTGTKEDASKLQQIVTAAAIAKDKRFPNDDGQFLIKLPSAMLAAYSVSIQVAPIATTPQPVVVSEMVQIGETAGEGVKS